MAAYTPTWEDLPCQAMEALVEAPRCYIHDCLVPFPEQWVSLVRNTLHSYFIQLSFM